MASRSSEFLFVDSIVAPSKCRSSEPDKIISFEDLMAALEDSRHERATGRDGHSLNFSDKDDGSTSSSWFTATEGSDAESFTSVFTNASIDFGSVNESPATSLYYDSASEEECKASCLRLSFLVEFGSQDAAHETSRPQEYPTSKPRSPSAPIHVEESNSSLGLSGCNGVERGSSSASSELVGADASYLSYTKDQLALFGDFLHNPFASSSSFPSAAIDASPFETEEHDLCDCEKCLLVEFALSRDLSELHPVASWFADDDSDPESD